MTSAPNLLKSIMNCLDNMGARQSLVISISITLILGIVDYLLGPEFSFSVFYTVPIMLATWYAGKGAGLMMAILSTIFWLCADIAAGIQYTTLLVPVWNTLVRLAFFIIILRLLLIVHEKLLLEESLADTDPLTGLANRRYFYEQLDRENSRIRRYPEQFTVASFDLDNFKYINDTMGHDAGDELLITVASTLSNYIRTTDFSARLGGDEFAILFPFVSKESAPPMLEKLQNELLSAMKAKEWLVTFSIGAVTFTKAMDSSRDMVKLVDDLMYEVKKSGKNNIRHIIWP